MDSGSETTVPAQIDVPPASTGSQPEVAPTSAPEQKEQKKPEIVQLIDGDLNVPPMLASQLAAWNLQDEVEYSIVSVLGCQSTGKSTLLNRLFGTNFTVMSDEKRTQTTLGVWCGKSHAPDSTVLVCDVEGSDSAQREESKRVEKKIALFSLALSEVLIINMNASDVGRREGANLTLFKVILELNLSLFQSQASKKKLLLFVFRDWSKRTALESLSKTMRQTLEDEWTGIQNKPEQYKEAPLSQFFDFDFVGLPHYDYERAVWEDRVDELQDRFYNKANDQFVLKSTYRRDGVPFDGFAHFVQEMWDTIQKEKDLDLPTQREMLAKYRCDEISVALLKETSADHDALSNKINEERAIEKNFAETVKKVLAQTLEKYDLASRRYDATIAASYKDELKNKFSVSFESLFKAQLKLVVEGILSKLEKKISEQISAKESTKNFKEILGKITQSAQDRFKEAISFSVVPELNWNYNEIEKGLNTAIQTTSKQTAQEQIKLFSSELKEQSKDRLGEALYSVLNEAAPTMWVGVRKIFNEEVAKTKAAFQTFVKEFDKILPENELNAKVDGVQETTLEILRGILDAKVGEIDRLMLAKFKKVFLFDADGTARTWEDDDLQATYKKAKQAGESLLDLFCILRLVVLMKKVEAHRALERFRDSANSELTIAKKDQERAMSGASIPTYMIVVFFFFAADEIYWFISLFLTSWIGLFFLMLLGMGGVAIHQLNLTPVIMPIVRPIANEAIRQVKEKIGMGGPKAKRD